jgi:hypothetical protein
LSGALTHLITVPPGTHYAYFCLEKAADWQSELKYPLLQRYLAEQIIEFRRYSPVELRTATQEAIRLFGNIHTEVNRLREGAGQ